MPAKIQQNGNESNYNRKSVVLTVTTAPLFSIKIKNVFLTLLDYIHIYIVVMQKIQNQFYHDYHGLKTAHQSMFNSRSELA